MASVITLIYSTYNRYKVVQFYKKHPTESEVTDEQIKAVMAGDEFTYFIYFAIAFLLMFVLPWNFFDFLPFH